MKMAKNDTDDKSQNGIRKLIIYKHILSRDEYNAMIEEPLWEDTQKSNQEEPAGDSDDDNDFLSTFDFDGFLR